MATIVVDSHDFHCHKVLLAYYWDYFSMAFFGDFAKASNNKVTLGGDITKKEFEIFIGWLYTGQMNFLEYRGQLGERLWVLGDFLLAPIFQVSLFLEVRAPPMLPALRFF